ncbi:unnamed protein product [Protopolystoma xenopodis]|uniref:Uncharacterized protein n=1 Tax=Protopolystoma xenopodis TaxID=117903 RepID=A0A3S5AJ88_9PLAT|nr:unnamed protein product [Protopolystoma xenopodis]
MQRKRAEALLAEGIFCLLLGQTLAVFSYLLTTYWLESSKVDCSSLIGQNGRKSTARLFGPVTLRPSYWRLVLTNQEEHFDQTPSLPLAFAASQTGAMARSDAGFTLRGPDLPTA